MNRIRIQEIDVLRGVAALAVLLSHYTAFYNHLENTPGRLGFEFKAGCYGVYLFFVISGFVIHMTLSGGRSAMDFTVSRLSRIFPAYWAAVLLTSIVLFFLHAPTSPTLATIAANLTMFQRFLGFSHIDSVYWTLNVELSFYFWMLLISKTPLVRHLEKTVAVVLLLQLIAALAERSGHVSFSQGTKAVLLLEYAHLFCAGILFHKIWSGTFIKTNWPLFAWCLLNQAAVPYRHFAWTPDNHWNIVAAATVFVVMFFTVKNKLHWMVSSSALYFGTISYPLYLLHCAMGLALLRQLAKHGLTAWSGIAITVPLVLLLATALSYGIERPAMKYIRDSARGRLGGDRHL